MKNDTFSDGIPGPRGDTQRCQVLCQTVGDPSKPDRRFDKLTAMLAKLFDVPICMVTLLDGEWTHTASGHGVSPSDPKLKRRHSFCAWSLLPLNAEVLVVPDATLDKRFRDLPKVKQPPHLTFYAGAPLVDRSGVRFGSLCLVDFKARHDFTPSMASVLCTFANIVSRQLQNDKGGDDCQACFIDISKGWTTLWCTSAWESGVNADDVGSNFWDRYKWWGATRSPDAMYNSAVSTGKAFTTLVSRVDSEKAASSFLLNLRSATSASVLPDAPRITIDMPTAAVQGLTDHWHNRFYIALVTKTDVCDNSLESVVVPDLSMGQLLGRGSFGAVYMGTYRNAPVAVKTVQSETAEEVELEAELGEKCEHLNIVQTYTHVTTPVNNMFETIIVMELCVGNSLRKLLDEGAFHQDKTSTGFVAPIMPKIVGAVIDICNGLAYLHGLDYVHTDLSSNNVLLTQDGNCKLCDFGLAHRGTATRHTINMGTITHMPVELLRDGDLSAATDLYSVGVIMWEMYTGARPWAGRRYAGVMAEKLQGSGVLVFPNDTPRMYRDLATTCMSPSPDRRLKADVLLKEMLHTQNVMGW